MDTRLLALLVCPICKGPLEHGRSPELGEEELVCRADRLAFPVRDGIAVMLESVARSLGVAEQAEAATPPEVGLSSSNRL